MLWVIWCGKSWIRTHTERTAPVFFLSSNLCCPLCKKQFPAKYFPSVNPTMQCAMQLLRLKRLTDIDTGDLSVVPGRELYSSFLLTWKPSEQLVMQPSCGQLFQVCTRDCFYRSSSGHSKAGRSLANRDPRVVTSGSGLVVSTRDGCSKEECHLCCLLMTAAIAHLFKGWHPGGTSDVKWISIELVCNA